MGRLMRQGDRGEDVRAVQDVLNFHIRRQLPLAVDGIFGPKTNGRVLEFQKANQLTVDGIVGPNTMAKLFEEEQLPLTLVLAPLANVRFGQRQGIQPPRLIPPLTLPPLTPPLTPPILSPFLLPPDSFTRIPPLTSSGQTISFVITSPVRSDPVDPATASFNEIMRLLNRLPSDFPFRASILGAVPRPVIRVGPLDLSPVSPMNFGFQWGVKPVFDFRSIGPPIQFAVGASVNARYTLELINRPGALLPQLGIFAQGEFRSTIDWTSPRAESGPLIDLSGSFLGGIRGTF